MDTIAEMSLTVLLFNGKVSTYDYWNPKFATRACKKKTLPIFLGATLVPPERNMMELFSLLKLEEHTLGRKLSKTVTLMIRLMMNC